jgi:hypothetical protein
MERVKVEKVEVDYYKIKGKVMNIKTECKNGQKL